MLAVLALAATALLALSLLARPAVIPDPPASYPARFDQLRDRLDPNTATAAELAVLPGIGPSKAESIVRFRETATSQPAFRVVMDLTDVYGIGEITAMKLAPYLHFGDAPPVDAASTPPLISEP